MDQTTIENTILQRLYIAYFAGNHIFHLLPARDELEMNDDAFGKVISRMEHMELIKGMSGNWGYMITANGISYAEGTNCAPEELKNQNQTLRTRALDALAKLYEESDSQFASYHYTELATRLELNNDVLLHNLFFLRELHYVDTLTIGTYKITIGGLEAVKEWRQRKALADEFEIIVELAPQPRGRAFQKLFAKVIESQGWSQEEGVRTLNEEMDVIIHKEREYYLAECKWEKSPIEADVVRELFGKLGNRIGVQGLIISMSGFTSGAIKQVEDYANSRVLILFGSEDTHSLVYGNATFVTLLDAKYKQIITRRKVEYS